MLDEQARSKDLGETIEAKQEAEMQPQLSLPDQIATQIIECRRWRDREPPPVNLKKLRETAHIITDIHEVYGTPCHQLGPLRQPSPSADGFPTKFCFTASWRG